jgi:light-regulated signal transduction histidine kinase (bacteriophytochrome)
MLEKSDRGNLSDRGQSHLANIADSAKQMGMLIDDLLVFSRMGRSEMRLGQIDLGRLVEETIESMRNDTQNRNIQWVKGSMPVVLGDRPMLRQVFVNLLSNAVKYTRPRDPAIIEIGCNHDSEEEWVVFVKDNGVGFEMKYVDKLFGVFQRLHLAEDFEGTGIGLANVRRIITRHGGRTWAEGDLDSGACFYFTLPKQRKDQT